MAHFNNSVQFFGITAPVNLEKDNEVRIDYKLLTRMII